MADTGILKKAYDQAIQHIHQHLQFETMSTNIQCPAFDHPYGFRAAQYSHTTTSGNVNTIHYDVMWMMPSTLNPKKDVDDLLSRSVIIDIADHFRLDDQNHPLDYLTDLFQYFVHDGNNLRPDATIGDVQIGEDPLAIFPEEVLTKYKSECELYSLPTTSFTKEYPNWTHLNSIVSLSVNGLSQSLPKIEKNTLFLDTIAREEYLTPLLQHLIKLRIIHLCLSELESDNPSLQQHPFFQHATLTTVLSDLQQNIQTKIQAITSLSVAERRAKASIRNSDNHYRLSPIFQKLAQHIPFAKLINGHAFYDIHHLSNNALPLSEKFKFYLKTYTNSSIIKYIAARTTKAFHQSMQTVRSFMVGQEKIKALPSAFFKLLKSLYLTIWLPFLATYFVISGLTSIPFSLLRKGLSISFGGKWDKALTGLEALKDMALIYMGAPIAYSVFTTAGSFLLGTQLLALGSTAAFYASFALLSPVIFINLLDHYDFKPGWYSIDGRSVYREESYYTKNVNMINAISLNSLVTIHMSIITVAFITFSAVSLTGFALNKLKEWMTPSKQCHLNDLNFYNRNLNHSPKMRKVLGELISKLNDHSCVSSDKALLSVLHEAQFNTTLKTQLLDYLNSKISQQNTPNKQVLTIARMQLKHDSFLPSWKLINALHTELPKDKNIRPELQQEIERLHKIHSVGSLAAYK